METTIIFGVYRGSGTENGNCYNIGVYIGLTHVGSELWDSALVRGRKDNSAGCQNYFTVTLKDVSLPGNVLRCDSSSFGRSGLDLKVQEVELGRASVCGTLCSLLEFLALVVFARIFTAQSKRTQEVFECHAASTRATLLQLPGEVVKLMASPHGEVTELTVWKQDFDASAWYVDLQVLNPHNDDKRSLACCRCAPPPPKRTEPLNYRGDFQGWGDVFRATNWTPR